jgi:hypothetical protein
MKPALVRALVHTKSVAFACLSGHSPDDGSCVGPTVEVCARYAPELVAAASDGDEFGGRR